MNELPLAVEPPKIHRARTLPARLAMTLGASGEGFETMPVASIELRLDGIAGGGHVGFVRRAGGREPWYPRGAEMRSGRQVTVISVEDLAEIAAAMDLPALEPGWIGADLVLEGLPRLSFLPAGTRLFLDGGASLVVEAQNAPCRDAGRAVARHTGRPGDDLGFPKAAKRLRGLVASVERPGVAMAGTDMKVRLPEQWIY
ncbi:MOSC domain-containing protein [Hansschlegelia quercus]|uniref:Molybdenum cofactor sulfurase n=1 Tax=Hansschlegelia quercus TaxID=2528245 RepID=A0A4Q9GNX3_9HYPH|nr:MOSC domain-containing protein [Hansschlegelia quercus]TBN54895.1 molybdenum cofactor sulfurase [Hansschlegelia quercus]